tara:strand:- start:1368 stop:2153 length:786 start_codon:yes stop_codon:yes gene_type:complete
MRMRDFELEENLQNLLERGGNIWAIGDVHGFFQTLEKMVQNLHLNDGDAVVMLGDLIDRGPTSAQVVDYVRRTEGFHSIRGNHEHMMIQGFDESSFFKHRSMDSRIWYHNGGKSTEASYLSFYGDDVKAREEASADTKWMESLATEIVLEDWRLVHAGYDQNLEVEEQDEGMHMNARKQFYTSKRPIDPKRTILFGHTPTLKHLHEDDSKAGEVWFSDVRLKDGRPMAIGMDTCLYHDLEFPRVLSAFNLQTGEVVYQNRV